MNKFYSDEKNIQILISLLKAHGVRLVVTSPGNTNLTLVASLQYDNHFTVYSSVDERSAAYMACGLAQETGEPVMLSCTGATASRNYMSGLTEAYYRKLPILAVTSSRSNAEIGHLIPQVTDRRTLPTDVVKLSVQLPIVKCLEDEWECNIKINQALLELSHRGGGPVHINIMTCYCPTYDTKELPAQRVVNRIAPTNTNKPNLKEKKVAILVGSHPKWSDELTKVVDCFCAEYDSVVFCDHTSGYHGKYRIQYSLIGGQEQLVHSLNQLDILIHIGEISGDYFSTFGKFSMSEIWRVSKDGSLCDTFHKLRYVFEMSEEMFFEKYAIADGNKSDYYQKCRTLYDTLSAKAKKIEEMPLSNIWIASQMADKIPASSAVHFSILSSLRSWNFFELPKTVDSYCTVGGFGIDGCMSSMIGSSLANPEKLHFGIIGDLAFFYDMNSLGNRHIGKNIRILLINNGIGAEFKLYCYPGSRLGEGTNANIAAEGHFGHKSTQLVKHFVTDLGFEYMYADSKEDVLSAMNKFLNPEIGEKSMVLEVFTTHENDSMALEVIRNIEKNSLGMMKKKAKELFDYDTINKVKKILGK